MQGMASKSQNPQEIRFAFASASGRFPMASIYSPLLNLAGESGLSDPIERRFPEILHFACGLLVDCLSSLIGAGAFRSTPEVLREEIGSRYSGQFVIGKDLDVY
jgi:hypothetical protein